MRAFPHKFTRRAGIIMIVAVAVAAAITVVVPLVVRAMG
tara:strand:+ start:3431 stop:3547 length:117 start_codon:yes stop_codon:yes gene_type:complete